MDGRDPPRPKRLSASHSPDAQSLIWDQRTRLVKDELEAERAASIAKTIKLKALRFEKTCQEAQQKSKADKPAPPAGKWLRTVGPKVVE